jgi:hypothetical protein
MLGLTSLRYEPAVSGTATAGGVENAYFGSAASQAEDSWDGAYSSAYALVLLQVTEINFQTANSTLYDLAKIKIPAGSSSGNLDVPFRVPVHTLALDFVVLCFR